MEPQPEAARFVGRLKLLFRRRLPPEPRLPPMTPAPLPSYLAGYPEHLHQKLQEFLVHPEAMSILLGRHPQPPSVTTDHLLRDYVLELKARYLKQSPALHRVGFDDRLETLEKSLGQHRAISRVQGAQLKAKRELRIASVLKKAPHDFLHMVAVHELVHLRHFEHDRAFYSLCEHIEPNYHQLELDLRLWLCLRPQPQSSGPTSGSTQLPARSRQGSG